MSSSPRHEIISQSIGAMMRFSDEAWQNTAALREAIHRLPFNTELAAGSLAPERFRFYILQDAIYLGQYSRVLALAAARAPDAANLQAFAQSALGAVAVEQRLHEHYLHHSASRPRRSPPPGPRPTAPPVPAFCWRPPITSPGRPWS